jgi:hypothetical protein
MSIITPDRVEKIARRLCVKAGQNPDEKVMQRAGGHNKGPEYKPYIRWQRYAVKVKLSLEVFECLFEILEEEKSGS